uniref:Uncharacterized protein n=1 Tax=Cacopsylla melanoneura TaxID=428564 RepID=A0A8D8M3D8_9HEMI
MSCRNMLGVRNDKSDLSSDMYEIGLELMTASQSLSIVNNSSQLTVAFPSTRFSKGFKMPIKRSQKPPHQGAEGGLNRHCIFLVAQYLAISSQSSLQLTLWNPIKFFPLSL